MLSFLCHVQQEVIGLSGRQDLVTLFFLLEIVPAAE